MNRTCKLNEGQGPLSVVTQNKVFSCTDKAKTVQCSEAQVDHDVQMTRRIT